MSNPFSGDVFSARAHAPQFPQRRAARVREHNPFARGGRVPGYFLGGLFGGSPGQSSTTQQSATQNYVTDPNYNSLMSYVLSSGLGLAQNAKFKPYIGPNGETNPMVGLTPQQQQGITASSANVGNYQPFFNQAQGALSQTQGGFNPNAGEGAVDQAGTMQTGSQAASPFLNAGTQSFPSSVAQYMSPYTNNVVQGIQNASNRNFEQNTMRTINDTFSGGDAASFGRERHGNAVGNAVFGKTQADDAAVANALESGYSTAGNLFNQDQNRQLSAGQTAGSLANSGIQTQAGLGQTQAAVQGANTSTGLGIAQGQQGLGAATQQGGINDINALEQTGAVGQNTAQNQSNFNYNQFQQQQQYPWQVLQAAQGLGQGWQLPTNSQTSSSGTSTVTQPQGSPFGQILGGALGAASLATPGAGGTSALGNIFGGIKGWFSADGGYLTEDSKRYAQGGMVPTIGQMRKKMGPKPGMGMMPTGMPGMPPMQPMAPNMPQPNGQVPQPGRGGAPYARGGQVNPFAYGGFNDDEDQVPDPGKTVSPPLYPAMPPIAPPPPPPSGDKDSGGGGMGDMMGMISKLASLLMMASRGGQVPGYDDGGLFLGASENLDSADPGYEMMRRTPFGPDSDMGPTGRDRLMRDDPLAYLWGMLPEGARRNGEFMRDMMPDRAIESYIDNSRKMGRSLFGGDVGDAYDSGVDSIGSMMGVMAPGLGRAAGRAFNPLVERMLRGGR